MLEIGYEGLDYFILEEKEEAKRILDNKEEAPLRMLNCMECNEKILLFDKTGKIKDATCPHCGFLNKIKIYKNGNIAIRRGDI